MAICDLDVAPAFERSKHHEEIGGAIALVLVIETGRASRFHRDRHARFGNELLRGLVEANQRTIAVAWPRVDGQHVFHSGYERAVWPSAGCPSAGGDGAEECFFERAPDRAVAGTIDNAEFYHLVFQQPQGPACASLGRLGTGQGNSAGRNSQVTIRPFRIVPMSLAIDLVSFVDA